jgi:homoserine dehydrogenase
MNIGILGLGTVGGGLINLLNDNFATIKRRTNIEFNITQVCVRDLTKKRICDTTNLELVTDPLAIINNPDIDVVVELIGGTTLAKDLVQQAITNGKHVVTANKALIASDGNELMNLAKEKNVQLLFEASVAGGIPILNVLKSSLGSNQIDLLVGIINGTGNFILTEMKDKNRQFADVLKEAQELGYAETDPTFDVEGIDAAHKLAILSAMAFGTKIVFDKVWTQGISELETLDVTFADELGYTIKHLGIAKKEGEQVQMRVHPTLIPKENLLANVNGVMNAVMVNGNAVGSTLYYGAGAGAGATASAVMADIIAITNNAKSDVSTLGWESLNNYQYQTIETTKTPHYLRLNVTDKTGVLADITKILASFDISVEAVLQKEPVNNEEAKVAIITNQVAFSAVKKSITEIEKCDFVNSKITHIFIETLN